jgi:hypothetical protein
MPIEPSVEQLVQAAVHGMHQPISDIYKWDRLHEVLKSFARTCGTCDGTGHGKWHIDSGLPPGGVSGYQGRYAPCPNPDCIDGKEYISAAREIDHDARAFCNMATDGWSDKALAVAEVWLEYGPKLLAAAEAILAEAKEAGLGNPTTT